MLWCRFKRDILGTFQNQKKKKIERVIRVKWRMTPWGLDDDRMGPAFLDKDVLLFAGRYKDMAHDFALQSWAEKNKELQDQVESLKAQVAELKAQVVDNEKKQGQTMRLWEEQKKAQVAELTRRPARHNSTRPA